METAVLKAMSDLDDKIWEKFYPDSELDTKGRAYGNAHLWLKNDIRAILVDSSINSSKAEKEIFKMINESSYAEEILRKYISLDDIKRDVGIRKDWYTALQNVKRGRDLSGAIGYEFSPTDIAQLAKLHKERKCRKKIEDLLEDCNFHYENGKFSSGQYDEFLVVAAD